MTWATGSRTRSSFVIKLDGSRGCKTSQHGWGQGGVVHSARSRGGAQSAAQHMRWSCIAAGRNRRAATRALHGDAQWHVRWKTVAVARSGDLARWPVVVQAWPGVSAGLQNQPTLHRIRLNKRWTDQDGKASPSPVVHMVPAGAHQRRRPGGGRVAGHRVAQRDVAQPLRQLEGLVVAPALVPLPGRGGSSSGAPPRQCRPAQLPGGGAQLSPPQCQHARCAAITDIARAEGHAASLPATSARVGCQTAGVRRLGRAAAAQPYKQRRASCACTSQALSGPGFLLVKLPYAPDVKN